MIASRRGLTLIEIIVALAIMAMIGAISAGTLSSSIDVLDGMEEAEGSTRTARIAMRRITKALELAYLTPNRTAVNTYQTVFVGKDDGDEDQVWFASLSTNEKSVTVASATRRRSRSSQAKIETKTMPKSSTFARHRASISIRTKADAPCPWRGASRVSICGTSTGLPESGGTSGTPTDPTPPAAYRAPSRLFWS